MNKPPLAPVNQAKSIAWHSLEKTAVLSEVGASESGLSSAEAALRLTANGLNALTEVKRISPWQILLSQFNSLIIWILIVAGVISGVVGEPMDAIAILAIVILNAVIGFYQEFSAEKSISALKMMTAPQAKVRRDGQVTVIPATNIVVGDILTLEAGDVVAADARVLQAAALKSIEAALTGESETVTKQVDSLKQETIPLADRNNMVFMGTSIATGTGQAVVVGTAMNTELGRIASLLEQAEADQDTPLQRKLDAFGRILVWVALAIVALLFILGLLRGTPLIELTMTSISLAVAAVPEGLPAVVTVALSMGVLRMARRKALVRKLPAVETLGSTSVICTDKTGTLTVGQMTVRAMYVGGYSYEITGEGYGPEGKVLYDGKPVDSEHAAPLKELATSILACNNAHLLEEQGVWHTVGDPTEGALLVAGAKAGVDKLSIEQDLPKHQEFPFDSDRKRSTVIRLLPDGKLRAFINGAPGILLERCTHVYTSSGITLLTEQDRERILNQTTIMAQQALRVLASAYRDLGDTSAELSADSVEHDLVFVGLTGMVDPPRQEAKEAVSKCFAAGIRVIMITGDHPHTALAIARQIGITSADDVAISGVELDVLSDQELQQRVANIAVYARVTAEHKLRIIRAWQANDAVVAMTGDGVNDAPAIRGADIGITMGKTGTDVTKQAADMIITDDNFATIIAAVELGRGIYDNIRKTLQYLLAGSTGELLLMTFSVMVGFPTPLLPIHLLWINLVTDGLPALCLATDPIDSDVMKRVPRHRSEPMTNPSFLRTMFLTGFLTAAVAFAVYTYVLQSASLELARTAAFAVLVFAELMRSFGARSETKPIWRISLFSNINLVIVVVISFMLQLWSQHSLAFGHFLKSSSMSFADCFLLLALGCIPLLVLEMVKVFKMARLPKAAVSKSDATPLSAKSNPVWRVVGVAAKTFLRIDGAQSAGAFAYYTFFSLFPLIVLFVTIASVFISRGQAGAEVIAYLENYIPINADMQNYIVTTLAGVINARGQAGIIAFLMLIWAAMQFFSTLISVTNRAWDSATANWWQLPLKSLLFLGIMIAVLLLGTLLPMFAKLMQDWLLPMTLWGARLYTLLSYCTPILVVFLSLTLFYKLAPGKPTRLAELWAPALYTTVCLQVAESLFLIYLRDFSTLNAVYGAFGGIMALLLWIYVSGCIFIFGACLCAAHTEDNQTILPS